MKKLLLLTAAALFASSTAIADEWYVIGIGGWNLPDNAIQLTEKDGVYTYTFDNLTSGFKILSDKNSWIPQYGAPSFVNINCPTVLDVKNTGNDPDPSNVYLNLNISSVKDATIEWNPKENQLTILADPTNIVYNTAEFPTLYVTGNFNGPDWPTPGDNGSIACTYSNGIYSSEKFNLGTSGNVEFKVCESWNGIQVAGGVAVNDEKAVMTKLGAYNGNLSTSLTGEHTLYFNPANMGMAFDDPALVQSQWAVVGSYTTPDWNFEASKKLTQNNNNWSCQIDYLTQSFKIVDIIFINDWTYEYGTDQLINLNTPVTLTQKGANIYFEGDKTLGVENVTVNWNPTKLEMTIEAAEDDIVEGYPVLYLTGSFNNWGTPGDDNTGCIEGTEIDGIYTFVLNLEDNSTEFKISSAKWSLEYAGEERGVVVEYDAVDLVKGGENLSTNLTGEQTLIFDFDAMQAWFVDPDAEEGDQPGEGGDGPEEGGDGPEEPGGGGNTAEINSINVDNLNQVEYYNLQGVKVNNPQNGVFIIRQNGKTKKIML